jgi:SAM-dependent methyltransferase
MSCVLCGKKNKPVPYKLLIPYIVDKIYVAWCPDCELGYQFPKQPHKSGIEYMDHRWSSGEGKYMNKKAMIARARGYLSLIEKGGDLLDFGCGDGTFMREAEKYFDSVTGMEESGVAIELSGAVSSADKKFDVITMWDVVEHLYDLNVEKIMEMLKPDGILYLETANYYKSKIYLYTHYWYFTPVSIIKLFRGKSVEFIKESPLMIVKVT